MFRNYWKIAIRNLKRDKVYSLINVFGLGVGMTAFILIALLLQYEFSFDNFHENKDRIYRVQQNLNDEFQTEWTQTVFPLSHQLRNAVPEIEQAAVIREIWGEHLSSGDNLVIKDKNGFLAEPQILDILSFDFIEGNPSTVLSEPGKVVLSEMLAQKLFPGVNPIGQLIKGSFTKDLIVTGIFRDYPRNSHLQPSYLVSFSTMDKVWGRDYKDYRNDWYNNAYRNYMLLKKNANAGEVDEKIKNMLSEKIERNVKTLYLKPLADIHLRETGEIAVNSPLPYYAAVALFIMILACINFINLTTARSGLREKEIGIRKVVGGSRVSLIKQFIGESVLVSMIAMIFAFLLVEFYLPIFNSYMQTQLDLNYFSDWQFISFIFLSFLVVGVLSGFYPAFYLSSFQPISVIKGNLVSGNSGRSKKGILRKALVTFQFIISISLILSTIFIFKQVSFMKNKDLGYNKSNLLRCYIEANESKSNFTELRNLLLNSPFVTDASVSENSPFHGNSSREINWEGGDIDRKINVAYNRADYNFVKTLGMEIVRGRNFSREFPTDSGACIINETLANTIGWKDPIGKKLWNNRFTVIGVVKDFHQYSVHNKIPPYLMVLHNGKLNHENEYCIRILPENVSQSIDLVKNKFRGFFPDKIFEVRLFDNNLDQGTLAVWYGVQNTFGFFSVLAIIIALIGLLGLVSFSTRRRTKEIGIRKVLGATEGGLYFLIVKEFVILLGASIILASPAAYYVLITAPGAYKYDITAGDFVFPIISIVVITFLITLKQVLSVTNTNPAESLHYE